MDLQARVPRAWLSKGKPARGGLANGLLLVTWPGGTGIPLDVEDEMFLSVLLSVLSCSRSGQHTVLYRYNFGLKC